MNKLILCEGATDAILLSYYLERTAGWKFVRKPQQAYPFEQQNKMKKSHGIKRTTTIYGFVQ